VIGGEEADDDGVGSQVAWGVGEEENREAGVEVEIQRERREERGRQTGRKM
jgi:hypothetical protein